MTYLSHNTSGGFQPPTREDSMGGEDLLLELTHHIEIECERCHGEIEIIATPESRGRTKMIVAPCGACAGLRKLSEIRNERKLAEDLKGNSAYCDGYRHALDWVLDPEIPPMDKG